MSSNAVECRLCKSTLADVPNGKWRNLFTNPAARFNIEAVYGCMLKRDDLPEWICPECLASAKTLFRFKRRLIESTQKLSGETNPFILSEEEEFKALTGEDPFKCSPKHLECPYCLKVFKQKSTRDIHLRIHTGEKPFKCDHWQCGKRFANRSNLVTHMRIHTGKKPYKCFHCRKRFNQKTSLNVHVRVHTGERPYACSECSEKFITKSRLNEHIRTHNGDLFKCAQCPKAFNAKPNLKRHMLTHTGERPFKCAHCSKDFTAKATLKVHIRKHAGELQM